MMGTQSYLSPQENVAVIHVMEEQVLRLAKSKQFLGKIFVEFPRLSPNLKLIYRDFNNEYFTFDSTIRDWYLWI